MDDELVDEVVEELVDELPDRLAVSLLIRLCRSELIWPGPPGGGPPLPDVPV